jgi:XTP/dITP diphosphohydrolase
VNGRIADRPRGDRQFHWDTVFIPDGFDRTFSELGNKKNDVSMRRLALNSFAEFLSSGAQHV